MLVVDDKLSFFPLGINQEDVFPFTLKSFTTLQRFIVLNTGKTIKA